jgi:acetolactate synthase I/II/III large subunit
MRVADLIVRRLLEAGVPTLFGVPGGGSNLDVIDAARRAGLPFVLTATETGAALAALAQTEVSGRVGACLTTLGPGVSSAVNGIACAFLDRAPVIVLTDCYAAAAAGATHQRLDHRALFAPVTKWSATVTAVDADAILAEATARATSGVPGPVHLDVPSDVASVTFEPVSSDLSRPAALATDDRRDLVDVLKNCRRPLVLVGLGARRTGDADAIRRFCAAHRVPAMVTYKAKGVVPDDDPHFAGVFTNAAIEQPLVEQADVLVGVGLDPVELMPRKWPYRQPVVGIGRWRTDDGLVPFAAQIVTEPSDGLRHLSERLSPSDWNIEDVRAVVVENRERIRSATVGLTPDGVVRTVASAARGIRVTVDAGAHMFPATMLWPVTEPNEMLISNGLSTMGFALPAAIGAALMDRERPVVALTGDGGLLMCAGELLTAARERLRIVVVVFTDRSLSLIAVKQAQRRLAADGVALEGVAWCALAESLGVSAAFASTADDLARAVARAIDHVGPTLIDARVDPGGYADMLRTIRG